MEKRRHLRFEIAAPTVLRWTTPDKRNGNAHGLATVISMGGLFVRSKDDVPTGATLQFEVQLASAIAFEGHGTVVRREVHGEEFGYAITTKNARINSKQGGNGCDGAAAD